MMYHCLQWINRRFIRRIHRLPSAAPFFFDPYAVLCVVALYLSLQSRWYLVASSKRILPFQYPYSCIFLSSSLFVSFSDTYAHWWTCGCLAPPWFGVDNQLRLTTSLYNGGDILYFLPPLAPDLFSVLLWWPKHPNPQLILGYFMRNSMWISRVDIQLPPISYGISKSSGKRISSFSAFWLIWLKYILVIWLDLIKRR